MPVIVIASFKGGVAKTATAVSLATLWHRAGRSVAAVDGDPNGHLSKWLERIGAPSCEVVDDAGIAATIRRLRASHELVVVDIAGVASMGLARAAVASDLVVIPTGVGEGDTAEAARTYQAVLDLREPPDPFAAVALQTRADPRQRLHAHARAQMQADGVPLLTAVLRHRVAYPEAWVQGASPLDMGEASVVADIEAVAAEILTLAERRR